MFASLFRPPSAGNHDLAHLDVLRIIAAFAIVAFHFAHRLDPSASQMGLDRLAPTAFLVDLFCIISGVVIAESYRDLLGTAGGCAKFFVARAARILPLHWLTAALFIAAPFVAARFGLIVHDTAHGCLLPNLLLLHAWGICDGVTLNSPSWSISAEAGVYLLAPLLLAMGRKSDALPFAVAATLIAVFCALYAAGAVDSPFYVWTSDFGVLRALPAFAFGIGLDAVRHRLALPRPATFMFALLAAFTVLMLLSAPRLLLLGVMYSVAVAAAAADSDGRRPGWAARVAPWSEITFGIYMLHLLIGTLVLNYLLPGRSVGAVLLAMLLTVIAAHLSLRFFETPARRWIRRAYEMRILRIEPVPYSPLTGTPAVGAAASASPVSPVTLGVSYGIEPEATCEANAVALP